MKQESPAFRHGECQPTPHGYAIVTSRGFEARLKDKTLLMDKWKDIVTLKRDDVLCVYWTKKEVC